MSKKTSSELTFKKICDMSEEEACDLFAEIRWRGGVIECPKCGSLKGAYKLKSKPDSKNKVAPGTYKCKKCRRKFTVKMGTIFEDSPIPMCDWLMVVYEMNESKTGVSASKIHRKMGITYKTAWFMCHRIRKAMEQKPLGKLLGIVEADETYVGGKAKNKHANKRTGKRGRGTSMTPVFALIERGGDVRAQKVPNVRGITLQDIIAKNVHPHTRIMTDEMPGYRGLEAEFMSHSQVQHRLGEYVNGDAYTNTAESWIALLKRGIIGTFHHVSERHLDRYVNEFSFRWNYRKTTDGERTIAALKGTEGKRLFYKDPVKH